MTPSYAWLKVAHIVGVTSWFAGLFYLPRLFVNLAQVAHPTTVAQLLLMARKLLRFMTGLAVLAVASGTWLWLGFGFSGGWLQLKLALVVGLVAYHGWCAQLLRAFQAGRNRHSHIWFRWFNEIPVVFLVAIVTLVIFKPFIGSAG